MELAFKARLSKTLPAVRYLLTHLPTDRIAELAELPNAPANYKLAVLAKCITVHGKLPPSCDWVWAVRHRHFLSMLLERLEPSVLWGLYAGLSGSKRVALLCGLKDACLRNKLHIPVLTHIIDKTDESMLIPALNAQPALLRDYPAAEPMMGRRLHLVLASIPEHGDDFDRRLNSVLAGQHILPRDEDRHLAFLWNECREKVRLIGRLQSKRSLGLRRDLTIDLDQACQSLVRIAGEAMSFGRLSNQPVPNKIEILRRIGRSILEEDLLPENWCRRNRILWREIETFWHTGEWPEKCLGRSWLLAGWRVTIISLLLAIFLVVMGGMLMYWLNQEREDHLPLPPTVNNAHEKAATTEPEAEAEPYFPDERTRSDDDKLRGQQPNTRYARDKPQSVREGDTSATTESPVAPSERKAPASVTLPDERQARPREN